MNNRTINLGKKKYIEICLMLLEEVDLLDLISNLDKRDQLEELMSNSDNKELLCEIITILKDKKMNNVEKNTASLEKKCLAYLAFNSIARKTNKSNNIFFYIGWPKICQPGDTINCRLYKDLETGMVVKIEPFFQDFFENEYRVIVLNYDDQKFSEDKMELYNDAREEFFSYLIDDLQEVAVKKILKYKK